MHTQTTLMPPIVPPPITVRSLFPSCVCLQTHKRIVGFSHQVSPGARIRSNSTRYNRSAPGGIRGGDPVVPYAYHDGRKTSDTCPTLMVATAASRPRRTRLAPTGKASGRPRSRVSSILASGRVSRDAKYSS